MKRIHIIGQKNSGKTTLIVELVRACMALGYRVGTIKHTHHQHELDTPGKDSHQHRIAGAEVVGILSQQMNAVFWPPKETTESTQEQRYAQFSPMFEQCDLILVEGDSKTNQPKIEVWREELGRPPMAASNTSITAIVSDDELQVGIPVWSRTDVAALAKNILMLVKESDSD